MNFQNTRPKSYKIKMLEIINNPETSSPEKVYFLKQLKDINDY